MEQHQTRFNRKFAATIKNLFLLVSYILPSAFQIHHLTLHLALRRRALTRRGAIWARPHRQHLTRCWNKINCFDWEVDLNIRQQEIQAPKLGQPLNRGLNQLSRHIIMWSFVRRQSLRNKTCINVAWTHNRTHSLN